MELERAATIRTNGCSLQLYELELFSVGFPSNLLRHDLAPVLLPHDGAFLHTSAGIEPPVKRLHLFGDEGDENKRSYKQTVKMLLFNIFGPLLNVQKLLFNIFVPLFNI